MAPISDFMLIREPECNLLALSYSVLGLCSYSFDPKALFIHSLQVQQTFYKIMEGERLKGIDEEYVDTLFLRCETT
jgi:hypothetical protein